MKFTRGQFTADILLCHNKSSHILIILRNQAWPDFLMTKTQLQTRHLGELGEQVFFNFSAIAFFLSPEGLLLFDRIF